VSIAGTLPDRVAEIMSRYNMLSPGGRLGVGVSGGADSVVLLHLLVGLSNRAGFGVVVLHLNHQLRGEESSADELFVRGLGEKLRVAVEVQRVALPEHGNLEQNARTARRTFFRGAMDRLGLNAVALGHTRSDQAETVLFRLLRGSGLAGLAGMRIATPDHFIRPLLISSRTEVRDWAERNGIAWREDSSNEELRFRRNRLRLQVLPALAERFNPKLEKTLAGTAELAQTEEDYWAARIASIYPQIAKRTSLASFLQVPDLMRLHLAEQRRVIRRAVHEVRGDLRSVDLDHIDGILRICRSIHGHDRIVIPGVDALRSFEVLRMTHSESPSKEERHYEIPVQPGIWQTLPFGAGEISITWGDCGPPDCVNFNKAEATALERVELRGEQFSDSDFPFSLYVRNWQPGDEIHLPGQATAKRLKFLFQEHRVLLWERKHWPVLLWKNEIVWVRRFGCSAKFKSSAESRNVLTIAYRTGAPESKRLTKDSSVNPNQPN
jgi:tRNA(Ile)-lysidine synthase